ncbi:MAG: hypothetical protein R3E96_16185 [Planctomycetota bacterium]
MGQELVPWTITVRAERNATPLADAEVLAWIDGQQAQARSDGEASQLQVPAGRAARLEVRATGFVPVRRPMLRSPEPVLVRMAQSRPSWGPTARATRDSGRDSWRSMTMPCSSARSSMGTAPSASRI